MAPSFRFRPVLKSGAVVHDLVVVQGLYVSRFERHLAMQGRIIRQRMHQIERLEELRGHR